MKSGDTHAHIERLQHYTQLKTETLIGDEQWGDDRLKSEEL